MRDHNPDKDILKNPSPTPGAKKSTTDGVLTVLKAGNGFISLLSGLLAAVLILYSSYVLYDSFATDYQAYSSSWDLLKYKPTAADAKPSEGADVLTAINNDYRAWLNIYDTTIDYPVVQGEDDLYYSSHNIYGETSLTGAIYLAAESKKDLSDTYNLIYGHHMDNGAMFGALDRFTDEQYFKDHQTGVIIGSSGVYDIVFFAVASTDAYEPNIYTTGNRAKSVINFLTGPRDKDTGIGTNVLIYDYEAARDAQKVIALSTCSDAETNGRLVLFGKMTKRHIDPVPTNTPEPKENTVVLTVHYMIGDTEIFDPFIREFSAGEPYNVISPQYPGYTADHKSVKGVIIEDTELYVYYAPNIYKLTIHYIYLDGTKAYETYTAQMQTGDVYNIPSPEIDGFTADHEVIYGKNPGKDEEYTVIYMPAGTEPWPEDTESPVPLEKTFMQIGVCYE